MGWRESERLASYVCVFDNDERMEKEREGGFFFGNVEVEESEIELHSTLCLFSFSYPPQFPLVAPSPPMTGRGSPLEHLLIYSLATSSSSQGFCGREDRIWLGLLECGQCRFEVVLVGLELGGDGGDFLCCSVVRYELTLGGSEEILGNVV